MTIEEALVVVDSILKPGYLNHVQELVLRQSWEGKTYPEIAASSAYDAEYVKNIGYQLWQSLSDKLGEKVTKSNFRSVLRRHKYSTVFPEQSMASDAVNEVAISSALTEEAVNQPEVNSATSSQTWLEANGEKAWEKGRAKEREIIVSGEVWQEQGLASSYQFPLYSSSFYNLRQDWEKAIDVGDFYGRVGELAILQKWIVEEKCRLVALLGMGGIGKTALSLKLAEKISPNFEYLIWRSLSHAPAIREILSHLWQFFSPKSEEVATIDEQIQVLIKFLEKHRCLVVLDGVEAILSSGDNEQQPAGGYYRKGYESYGKFFQRFGEECHQSCLLLTSREQPKELGVLVGKKVRSFQLKGLTYTDAQKLFKQMDNSVATESLWQKVIQMYQGNPLALKIAFTTIQDLFDGNVAEFLCQNTAIFGSIRDLLNQQFERLSELEKEIMYWLAAEQETVSVQELQQNIKGNYATSLLLESLESLKRRCLIETKFGYFTQQQVVKEYIKNRLLAGRVDREANVSPETIIKRLLQSKNTVINI
ncbi:NB-ARC domain-containing protein [Aerosakkonemataceae cyanobacterium BLCC-F154]|uniref:NB-ARC domain-containing protein n=1 Tax=Floridaenema fluviatile BLCC-F154 TaxID=3153640 RepID=A0ABV4YLK8_9CYAN